MRNFIKKIIGLGLAICLITGTHITTYASECPSNLGEVVDGSVLTNEDSSESIFYNPARGNILNRGVAQIADNGNGSVNAYGAVFPAVQCDTLKLAINIQRLENSTWVNVKTYSSTAYNASLLTKSYNCTVTKGYYYRVMAGCVATKGGITETQMPVTNGIWID